MDDGRPSPARTAPGRNRILLVNTNKTAPVHRLHDDPGLDVTTITEPRYAPLYPSHADVRLVDNVTDLGAVTRIALRVMSEKGVDRVVAPTERSLPVGGYLRSVLGLPGIGFDVANAFTNKYVMKERLAAAVIPVAPYLSANGPAGLANAAAQLGYPVVVKPAIGVGSKGVFVVRDPGELDARGPDNSRCRVMVERYVDMAAEYHADGIVHEGRTRFLTVSRYLLPLLGRIDDFTGSYQLPVDHPDQEPVRRLHDASVAALGLTDGVTHLELFRTSTGFLVGEITCRPGGGGIVPAIRLATGVDLWQAFIDIETGRRPTWAFSSPGRIVVNCDLPIRPGRVTRITGAEELRRLPDVVDVRMSVRTGDIVRRPLHSASATGIVYFAVAEESDVADRVAAVARSYVLETDGDA